MAVVLAPIELRELYMLKVNEYFDGNVKSIAFQSATLPATVGVMEVGEYEFATDKHETITVVSGKLTVRLPGAEEWQEFGESAVFEVAANEKFQVRVDIQTAYLCTYQ